jgi:hypothetical protein
MAEQENQKDELQILLSMHFLRCNIYCTRCTLPMSGMQQYRPARPAPKGHVESGIHNFRALHR